MEREQYEHLSALGKEDLIRLIEIYSKNWLALDGVWFQSVERKRGMDEAMEPGGALPSLKPGASRRFWDCPSMRGWRGLPQRSGCGFMPTSTPPASVGRAIRLSIR